MTGDDTEGADPSAGDVLGDAAEGGPPAGGEAAIRAAAAAADGGEPDDLELAWKPRSDLGNAERLIARHGRDLVYVTQGDWAAWDGRRWNREDGAPEARIRFHRTVRAMRGEVDALAAAGADKDTLDALRRHANSSGNNGKVEGALKNAQPYLRVAARSMDADPLAVTVANGTLRLRGAADVNLTPHARGDLITRLAAAGYRPSADAPEWQRFLAAIQPDGAVRGFLQRYFGYCLTGLVSEQVMLVCYGTGANGKSTLVKHVARVLGDYAATLPIASLLQDERRSGSEASPDLARLPGVRLVMASEPERGAKLSESTIKQITGGEALAVRHLFREQFEFPPAFKLVITTNHKPRVQGQDEGIWRRLLMVPFHTFIPYGRRDPDLDAKLEGEADGILNWLLDGYRLWREQGLSPPDVVREATDEYRVESDPVADFLATCTRRVPGTYVRAKALYDAYEDWARDNGQDPMSATAFGRRLVDRGIRKKKAGVVFYADMELVEEAHGRVMGGLEGSAGDPLDR